MMNAYPRCSFLALPLLAALGCSDPVPPPAQGAVTLYLGQPSVHVDQMTCPITQTYQVGAVDSKTKATLAPTMSDPGQSLISGENSSTITCSVKGGGGNFNFSGSLHAITPQGDVIGISFTNGVVGADFKGTADVQVITPQLLAGFSSPSATPCTIAVQNQQVKGGSIWATFSCPQVSSPPSGLCGISAGSTIVFENCSGS